jgi:hypothetical protein
VKKKKLFIAGILLLLVVLIARLPIFLSSGWGLNLLVNQVNKRIAGEISVKDCSFGWQQGIQCSDILFRDADQGVQLSVSELRVSQGLLALAAAPKNLGTVTVDDPLLLITYSRPSPPAAPASTATTAVSKSGPETAPTPDSGLKKQTRADRPVSEPAVAAMTEAPFWEKMRTDLLINRATVQVAIDSNPAATFIQNGFLNANLSSETVNFEISLETGSGEGAVTAAGEVRLPLQTKDLLVTLATDIKVTVRDVQTEPFLAMVPQEQGLPRGRAKVSADLTIKTIGNTNLAVYGPLSMTDVTLAGGFLGEDQPKFKKLAIDLDLKQTELNSWQFPALQLKSDFGNLQLAGSYDLQNFTISSKGIIDLPVLVGQLPHLFKIQENTELVSGTMDFTLNVEKKKKLFHIKADTVVDDLVGKQNSRSFSWNSPVTMSIDSSISDNEPDLKNFTLKAPFLDLQGKGNLNAFSLNGSADLQQAMEEIGRIIQLDWGIGGKLQIDLQSEKKGENRYSISSRVDIGDFSLAHKGKTILAPHHLGFNAQVSTPDTFPTTRAEAMELSFDLASWFGKIRLSMDGLFHKNNQLSGQYQIKTNLMLGRLTELLQRFDILDTETSLAGMLDLQTSGYLEEDRVLIRSLETNIYDFILYRQGKLLQESEIHLYTTDPVVDYDISKAIRKLVRADSMAAYFATGGGCNLFDAAGKRLVLHDLAFTSGMANIKTSKLSIEDWQAGSLPRVKALKVRGNADLAKLSILLQQIGILTAEQTLAGNASLGVDLTNVTRQPGKVSRENVGKVELSLAGFSVIQGKDILLDQQEIRFSSRIQGDLASGDVDFTSIALQSDPLLMQASGKQRRTGKSPYFSLSGTVTPDLGALLTLYNAVHPLDIRINGTEQEKFSIYYPLATAGSKADSKKDAERFLRIQFASQLDADSLARAGITVSRLSVPVSMKNGLLQAALTAKMNKGSVKFSPKIDYSKPVPLLSLAEPEQIITDVQLDQALTNGLLKGIHPLLGSLAQPSGSISVRVDRFSWPLSPKGAEQADFSTLFDVGQVTLKPTGALRSILDMAGFSRKPLTLKENTITCEGKKGRISCSPLELLVAGSEMTLSGSAGFDGSLDYLLEIPVTKNLVGKEGYRILKGTTLKVPIIGDKDKPVYDPDALSQAVSDLLGQAAGKAANRVIEKQVDKVLPGLLDGLMGR